MQKFFLYSILLILISCGSRNSDERINTPNSADNLEQKQDKFEKSKVISSVLCSSNPSYSFSLYLPHQYDSVSHLPVLIFLDPHATGALPLNKYQKLAEDFGVILMGSNDSKNGMTFEQTNEIVNTLIAESRVRLKEDSTRISLCGFSGGAKVALIAGANLSGIQTVIYCGAGLPQNQILDSKTTALSALGFAGTRDLNYTEVIQTDEAFQQRMIPHALVEWNGKHEWVDSISFADAFYWITFNSPKPHEQKFIDAFISANSSPQKNPLDEWRRLKKMIAFLSGVVDVKSYITSHETLIKSKDFKAAVGRVKIELQEEMRLKQQYVQNIDDKDLNWWKEETTRLKNSKGDKEAMSQRLLGYISLACYGLSTAAIKQSEMDGAQKILSIYQLADPANPDRAYLQATLFARLNNKTAALQSLFEAVKLGFNDKEKLMKEDAFVTIRNEEDFRKLTERL